MIRPHVHIINFKPDLCTCMCMQLLLSFEFNDDGMFEKKRDGEKKEGSALYAHTRCGAKEIGRVT